MRVTVGAAPPGLIPGDPFDPDLPTLPVAALPDRIGRLGPGERLVLAGIGRDGVADALRAGDDAARGALLVATEGLRGADALLDRLLDDLARLALARWPDWSARGADPSAVDGLSGPWLKAAGKHAAAGRPPRFRRAARAVEFVQLARAVEPAGLLLVAEVDPAAPARAAPVIQALEWCAGQGAIVVAALPAVPSPTPPFDRILYGAHRVVRDVPPAEARFIAPGSRAHHASAVERRLEAALHGDDELGPLFACNARVPLGLERTAPRVDFLWREGRVVVELDGPEHRGEPKFGADRHRDYELLIAGYLVLRITNAQAETDLPRAVEKIRDVVRLRRHRDGEPIR